MPSINWDSIDISIEKDVQSLVQSQNTEIHGEKLWLYEGCSPSINRKTVNCKSFGILVGIYLNISRDIVNVNRDIEIDHQKWK